VSIDFIESLCGWTRAVPTIDGKRVRLSPFGTTGPNWKEVFPELGMPNSQEPSKRGDLVVGVDIEYPLGSLREEQKVTLKHIFGQHKAAAPTPKHQATVESGSDSDSLPPSRF
jgi:DnaJ family protein B protein 4